MPRLSKKAKHEWSVFILTRAGRRTYNKLCRKYTRSCKQSYQATIIECPKFFGNWTARRDRKKHYFLNNHNLCAGVAWRISCCGIFCSP